jgi:hypothetical protein
VGWTPSDDAGAQRNGATHKQHDSVPIVRQPTEEQLPTFRHSALAWRGVTDLDGTASLD